MVPPVYMNPSGVTLAEGHLVLPHDGRFVKNDTLGDPTINYSSWSVAEGPANTCMMQVQNYLGTRAEMIANQHKEYYWTLPNGLTLRFRYYNVYSHSTTFPIEFALLDSDNNVLKSHSISVGGFAITNNVFYACPIVAVDVANYTNAYLGIVSIVYRDEGSTRYGGALFTYQNNSYGDVMEYMHDLFEDLPDPPGPLDPGGTSERGGGDGDFDETSDPIPIPPDPTISAASSGLVTLYNPTLAQMRSVADALLNPSILTALANNVVKLSDVIIGLSIFPLSIPDGGSEYIKVNLLGFQWNTGVQCTKALKQFITLNCGTININEYWGSCLDYSPFTQIGIFLPYCGYFPLNVDEVMGHTLGVVYKVDLFSGQCIAFITVDDSVHYQFTGNCSTQIPISSQSYDGLMSALLEFAGSTAEFAGSMGERSDQRDRIASGEGIFGAEDAERANATQRAMDKRVDQNACNLVSATLGVVMGSKPNYNRTGMIHGPAGFMGVQKPYVNIIRPRQSLPEGYARYEGFPSNITEELSNLEGFTKVESIKLSIEGATALEKEAIITLLQGGVYL